ncbi:MAG: serine/threonine-protein kinase [Planctomycetota bacterium]|nr:serine/threonine-protein kinase [Planctomycetota bacterium]
MAVTAAQLSEQLQKAGLISGDQVQACCDSAGSDLQSIAPEKLAKQLVKDGRLTLFQAQLAVNGKASSLTMGSYVILEKLGQGGMRQVYKARHQTMKREVAVKVISSAVVKNDASRQRFQREVEAAARLIHPNIVTAHDAGEARGTHYLVMEYIKGRDLSAVVKASGPLKVLHAVECVLQTAQGLAYAHGRGIVHRDIKPANLLQDESGTIKILDMGLARFDEASMDHAAAAGLTGTGVLMGTVDYMSPEQAMDSKTADAKSDIYSLGCTLFFLMTGKPIYEDDTIVKRLMAHQSTAIPKLPTSDPALQSIFERMVAKKFDQRFATTDLLVAELQQWLNQHRNSVTLQTTGEMTILPIGDESEFPGLKPLGSPPGPLPNSKTNAATVSVLPKAEVSTTDTSPSVSAAVKTVSPGGKQAATSFDAVGLTRVTADEKVTIQAATEPVRPSRQRNPKLQTRTQPKLGGTGAGKATGKKPWLMYGGIGGGVIVLALLASIIFRVKTPMGTIVIETDQPEIAGAVITVDEQQMITLVAGKDQEPIEIKADDVEHTLRVTKGGFQTRPRSSR